MKFLLLSGVFCMLVATIAAATARGQMQDPEHPGKCVVDGLILSPGEEAQQNSGCGRMICGSEGWVEYHTCGSLGAAPGYKIGEPVMPKAPYPKCCKRAYIKV